MMNYPSLVDTHAHLDMGDFDVDRPEMIARAATAGVTTIISVGIDIESSRKAIELSAGNRGIYAAVGIHPHDAQSVTKQDIDKIGELAGRPRVVAIGETGLDFYRNHSPKDAQMQALNWHIDLSLKSGLPIIIHCREAEAVMLELLKARLAEQPNRQYKGVIHCFSGSLNGASQYLAMGFHLSLGGYVSYPSSKGSYDIIRSIPADRLLVETDCPFLPPQSYRGKRNEPSYLPLTVKALAEIRKEAYEDIAAMTTRNAIRLFLL